MEESSLVSTTVTASSLATELSATSTEDITTTLATVLASTITAKERRRPPPTLTTRLLLDCLLRMPGPLDTLTMSVTSPTPAPATLPTGLVTDTLPTTDY